MSGRIHIEVLAVWKWGGSSKRARVGFFLIQNLTMTIDSSVFCNVNKLKKSSFVFKVTLILAATHPHISLISLHTPACPAPLATL